MASELQQATIKIRRDTAANWTSNDPTPLEGEWCLETDTKKIKIGDGSTAWSSLDYSINPYSICTAWVNFNGTGTVAIRDSFNVSSITDNGTGDYTINFTNTLDDANYSAIASFNAASGGDDFIRTANFTTSSFDILLPSIDANLITAIVFGGVS